MACAGERPNPRITQGFDVICQKSHVRKEYINTGLPHNSKPNRCKKSSLTVNEINRTKIIGINYLTQLGTNYTPQPPPCHLVQYVTARPDPRASSKIDTGNNPPLLPRHMAAVPPSRYAPWLQRRSPYQHPSLRFGLDSRSHPCLVHYKQDREDPWLDGWNDWKGSLSCTDEDECTIIEG